MKKIHQIRNSKATDWIYKWILEERVEKRLKNSFKDDEKRNNNEFFESKEFNDILKEKIRTNKERVGWPELGATREWNERIKILQFIEKNKHHLERSLTTKTCQDYVKDNAKLLILNADFWKKVNYTIKYFQSIHDVINTTQPDTANISQFYFDYQQLMTEYIDRANTSTSSEDTFIALEVVKSLQKAWEKFFSISFISSLCND